MNINTRSYILDLFKKRKNKIELYFRDGTVFVVRAESIFSLYIEPKIGKSSEKAAKKIIDEEIALFDKDIDKYIKVIKGLSEDERVDIVSEVRPSHDMRIDELDSWGY